MPREYYTTTLGYDREHEDRVSLRAYRAQAFQDERMGQTPINALAQWLCSDVWTDVTPFLGTHNQPPVSGEIDHTPNLLVTFGYSKHPDEL